MAPLAPERGSVSVLCVDDDKRFLEMTESYLEREIPHATVHTATGFDEARDTLEAVDVDCVVSDHDMPEKTGLEFLRDLREEHTALPFILFTGKGSEEIASEAISAGVTDYLQKRGTEQFERLAKRITHAVAQSRTRSRLKERVKELNAIQSVSTLLSSDEPDVGEKLQQVVDRIPQSLRYPSHAVAELKVGDRSYRSDGYDTPDRSLMESDVSPEGEEVALTVGYVAPPETEDEVDVFLREEYALLETLLQLVMEFVTRRTMIDELKSERGFVESLAHSLPDPVYALDLEGYPVRWNDAFEEATGYPADDIEKMHATAFVPEDEADDLEDAFEKVVEHRSQETLESAIETEDGERIPYELTGAPLEGADGETQGVTGVGRDITERKKRERKLRMFRNATESSGHSVYFTDTDGVIEYVNPAFEELTGYSREEALGRTPEILNSGEHDEDFFEEIWTTITDSEVWRSEIVNETKDGDRYVVDQTIAPIEDDDGEITGFVAVNVDVTERLKYEEQLRRQNDRLEEFSGVVSHDLRNPLSVAQGRLEMAMEDCDSEHLEDVASAHQRMQTLIDDLLTLARAKDREPELEDVQLAAVAREAWGNVETVDADLAVEADTTVEADEPQLKQILENLFRNSVEHGGEDVSVSFGALEDGFYVEDDGAGMPEDSVDPFDSGYTTSESGNGFGLSIVRDNSEKQGWKVEAKDGGEGGARFEFRRRAPGTS